MHTTTVIIGGGQGGLAMSRCLSDRSIDHVVLERGEVANSWRTERWDSLRLLTPNWQCRLPGFAYAGPDPHGFMLKDEIVKYVETANRSHNSAERKFWKMWFAFGSGNMNHAYQNRPT